MLAIDVGTSIIWDEIGQVWVTIMKFNENQSFQARPMCHGGLEAWNIPGSRLQSGMRRLACTRAAQATVALTPIVIASNAAFVPAHDMFISGQMSRAIDNTRCISNI